MRELTADTIIRVRRPRPEPRKRELTGDTRIRLSQIADLKDWALEMAQDEAAPEGTVHHWSDGDHIKKNGKWVPVQRQEKEITMSMGTEPVQEKRCIQNFIEKHNKGVYPKTVEEFAKISNSDIYQPGKTKLTAYQSQLIETGIRRLKECTGNSFKHILIIRNPELAEHITVAQMHPKYPDTIMLNFTNNYWNDETQQKDYLSQTSTKDPAHPFLHEEGHRRTKPRIEEWEGDDAGFAFWLSNISRQSPAEFCAEYYAAKITNTKLKPKIRQEIADKLYEKYGGEL
ncbi:MAG: hypothetical protein J6P07_02090 [Spirochaetaceae bacterium]|nr:hypothetical protein [Spirochaetaceae bacterium]